MNIKRIFDNKFAAAILPLIPLFLAASFKFSVNDHVNGDAFGHIYQNYIVGAWIDIITLSFIGAIAWGYASLGHEKNLSTELAILISIPIVTAVICLVLTLGGPKLNYTGEWVTVYIPILLSIISVSFCSVMIREVSK